MILNVFAILDAFVTVLRLAVAALVIVQGIVVCRAWRRAATGEAKAAVEDRGYLLFLLAGLLLLLNLVSWPLLYLLLDSYVPAWPGVMCIYGVTQIGAGSEGASRFLPGLLQALQALKPALVFASGAWAVLYLANRGTPNAALMGRVISVLIGAGLLAAVDAAAEAAYLVIPKHEEFLAGGCCTGAFADDARFMPTGVVGEAGRWWLGVAFWAVNGSLAIGWLFCIRVLAVRQRLTGLGWLLAGAVAGMVVGGLFLIDIAAPRLLHLPHHHCPYDLIARAPEAVVAMAVFVGAIFTVGWTCTLAWFARRPETLPFLVEQVRRLLVAGWFGFVGALVMLMLELLLV